MPNKKQQKAMSNTTSGVLTTATEVEKTDVEKILNCIFMVDVERRIDNSLMKKRSRLKRRAKRFKHGRRTEQHSFLVKRKKPQLKVDSNENIYFLPKKRIKSNRDIKQISNSKIRNLNSRHSIPNGASYKRHYTYEQHMWFRNF